MNPPSWGRIVAAGLLLISSLLLVIFGLVDGAVGLVAPAARSPEPSASASDASADCDRVARPLFLWESPVITPFEHSGFSDAILSRDVDLAWMKVSADDRTAASWSLELWVDDHLVRQDLARGASGPYARSHELGPLEEGVYGFAWRQSGLIEGLAVEIVGQGCEGS